MHRISLVQRFPIYHRIFKHPLNAKREGELLFVPGDCLPATVFLSNPHYFFSAGGAAVGLAAAGAFGDAGGAGLAVGAALLETCVAS